jgi:hypothetical protein
VPESAPNEPSNDFAVRSNIVLLDAWDDIWTRHVEQQGIVGVLISLPKKIGSNDAAVEVRFHVLTTQEQARVHDDFARYSPETAAAIAAPHHAEIVRVLFVEDPSGEMRFLTLPTDWLRRAEG